ATAELIFKNAGDASTPDDPALAAMAARFLQLPPDMDPQLERNTNAFSRTGTRVICRSNDDEMGCYTRNVNIYLDVMLKGLERKVAAGVYDQDQIEMWQKHTKENWKLPSTQEENEYIRQVQTALYGPDHPYTKTAIITPDAASKIH